MKVLGGGFHLGGLPPAAVLVGAVAQFGRARDWQSRGRGFDPHQLHHEIKHLSGNGLKGQLPSFWS